MRRIINIVWRELRILRRNPIYMVFMVVMPIVAVLFFTTILRSGQPVEMPVGVVDQDYTPITRRMARLLPDDAHRRPVRHGERSPKGRAAGRNLCFPVCA